MSTTVVRQIKLRRWFPPEDLFAAYVARMTILREDFAIEMMGIYEEQIAPLDGNTEGYRMVYFWRNMLRTLSELRGVVVMLNALPEFQAAMGRQSPERRQQFPDMFKKFERIYKLLKNLRDDIGGHVRHTKIEAALNGMEADRWGFLELGETLNKTHYRFAGELLLETQLTGLAEEKRMRKIKRQIREIAKLLPVFALMELVFATYVEHRKLDE